MAFKYELSQNQLRSYLCLESKSRVDKTDYELILKNYAL